MNRLFEATTCPLGRLVRPIEVTEITDPKRQGAVNYRIGQVLKLGGICNFPHPEGQMLPGQDSDEPHLALSMIVELPEDPKSGTDFDPAKIHAEVEARTKFTKYFANQRSRTRP